MAQENGFKSKKEASIWAKLFKFISSLFSWFSSLFRKKEAPTEVNVPVKADVFAEVTENRPPKSLEENPTIDTLVAAPAKAELPTENPSPKTLEENPTIDVLLAALKKGENAAFEALLKKSDPKMVKENPSVLLYVAVEKGNLEAIKLLSTHGVEVSSHAVKEEGAKEGNAYSALEIAIKDEQVDIVNLCLDKGLKFKKEWLRPLLNSSEKIFNSEKAVAIFKVFLDKTPFSFLDKKIFLNEKHYETQYFGAWCLREATRIGHVKSIEQALENDLVDTVWPQEAVEFKHLEIAKLFLAYTLKRPDIKLDFIGATSLTLNKQNIFFSAVKSNNLEIVRYLINSHTVDFNADEPVLYVSDRLLCALYHAVENKNPEMVKLLLDSGATFGEMSYVESEIECIETYRKQFGTKLPTYKIDPGVEIRKKQEQQKLEEVAKKARKEFIDQYRAKREAENRAAKAEKEEIEKEIQEENTLVAAIKNGDIKTLTNLVETTAPEKIHRNPSVLLHHAIVSGQLEIVQLLMTKGVNLTFKTVPSKYGYHKDVSNAFQLAIKYEHLDLVNLCLDNNLPFDQRYLDPIAGSYSARFPTEEKKTIFKTLLDRALFDFRSNTYGGYSNSAWYREEAIKMGHIESLKRVLSQEDNHFAPYWVQEAINFNQVEILSLFLTYSKGLEPLSRYDLNATMGSYNFSRTPLYYAIENKHNEMVKLLLKEGATFGSFEHSEEEVAVIENYKKEMAKLYEEEVRKCFRAPNEKDTVDIINEKVVGIINEYVTGELPPYRVIPKPKAIGKRR